MTQEDKDLLLKDLCARLPYGLMVRQKGSKYNAHIVSIDIEKKDAILQFHSIEKMRLKIDIDYINPYLRPMSSMTEEEENELSKLLNYEFYVDDDCALCAEDDRHRIAIELMTIYIKYLIEHHFDYRGLIEKGLALEAPEGMYNFQ